MNESEISKELGNLEVRAYEALGVKSDLLGVVRTFIEEAYFLGCDHQTQKFTCRILDEIANTAIDRNDGEFDELLGRK